MHYGRNTHWQLLQLHTSHIDLLPIQYTRTSYLHSRLKTDPFRSHSQGDSLASLVAALFLFLLASTPLSYLVSIPFTSPAAAVAAQLGGYVFFGVAQLVAGVTLGGLAETGQTKGGAYDAWQVMKVRIFQLPRSASAIAHTRTRRDYYDQKGLLPKLVTVVHTSRYTRTRRDYYLCRLSTVITHTKHERLTLFFCSNQVRR